MIRYCREIVSLLLISREPGVPTPALVILLVLSSVAMDASPKPFDLARDMSFGFRRVRAETGKKRNRFDDSYRRLVALKQPCSASHLAEPLDGSLRLPRLVGTATV
jgi:hypothetical protein